MFTVDGGKFRDEHYSSCYETLTFLLTHQTLLLMEMVSGYFI